MAQPEQASDASMEEILASIRKIIAEDSEPEPGPPPRLAVVPSPGDSELSGSSATKRGAAAETLVTPAPTKTATSREAEEDTAEAETADIQVADTKPADAAPDSEKSTDIEDVPDPVVAEPEQASGETAEDDAWSPLEAGDVATQPADDGHPVDEPPGDPAVASELDAIAAAITAGEQAGGESPAETLLSPRTDEVVQTAFDQLTNTILSGQARTLEDLMKDMMRPMLRQWLDDNLPVLVERLVREEIVRVSRGRR